MVQLWLNDLEIFAVLLSALIHDFEHTGTTNAFHVNTRHATLYRISFHLPNSNSLIKSHLRLSCLVQQTLAGSLYVV